MPDENSKNTNQGFDAAQAAAEFAAAMAGEPGEPAPSDAGNYTAILEGEVETLERMLADKDEALRAAQEKSAAASAEVDRVRTRIEREAERTIDRAHRAVLLSVLEVADDLDRAVEQLSTHEVPPAVAQGVQMVRSKLHAVLAQHRARHRPSLGLPFDSAHHEAVSLAPATDATPAGSVVEVLSEGYELDEQTLRPAKVVVAKA